MPLHEQYEVFLQQIAALSNPPLHEVPVETAREMFRTAQPPRPDIRVHSVVDTEVPGPDGNIPVRVYSPGSRGPYPIAVMYHGGGWVIGDLDTADIQSRLVCNGSDAIVVSVDYRLAPENRFPAAAEDSYAALLAVEGLAEEFGGNSRAVAVVGDSAGGNLAAVVAQMAHLRKGPELVFQLLVYPVTDGTGTRYLSYTENAEGYLLTAEAMRWFWDQYCPIEQRADYRASPICADDLAGLPPALVMTAEFDPLRDEGNAYGQILKEAGVETTIRCYEGFIHGFFSHSQIIPCTQVAMDDAVAALKKAFTHE